MPNTQKLEAVAHAKKLFEESKSFFVTDYQGLDVAKMTVLRKSLRENSVTLLIEKNTLFRIAAAEAGAPDVSEHLIGPTAIAFAGEDPVTAAKILHDAFKEYQVPRMKVFVVDDQMFSAEDIQRYADLPPMNVLMSQLVAAIESPLTSLVGALDGFFRELVGSLDALVEKKKTEADA